MSLLAPWLLLGLVGTALPVLIHLVGRRRARRQPFAAFDFLLQANRKMARQLRLRQLLLLATRVALVAVLVVTMSKPVWETAAALPQLGGGAQSTVVVVDDTMSMQRKVDGMSLFERARARAKTLVAQAGGQARYAIISVTRPDGPLAQLTSDQRRLRDAVERLEPTLAHATLAGALARAGAILGATRVQPRRVVLLSDMAAHGKPDEGVRLPAGVGFVPIDLAPGAKGGENVALVDLRTDGSTAPGHRSVAIRARVCNYRWRRWTGEVRLVIDGKALAQGSVELEPRSCGEERFDHTFERGGVHEVAASLPADELSADDVRYLRVDVRAEVRALLVDGSPSPIRHLDELFYLETALESPAAGKRRIVSQLVTADQFEAPRLADVDVLLLCNVKELQREQAAALSKFVEKGGGLLITVGDNVQADVYNGLFGALLPQALRGPVVAEGTARDAAFSLGAVDAEHPVLAALWSDSEGAGLRQARFARAFRLWPAAGTSRRVLLRYDDSSPALVEAQRGAGRVALFTSSIDRDWTDLPIRPGYAPLFQQIVRYLSGTPLDVSQRKEGVGARVGIKFPAGTLQLRLEAPGETERTWSTPELRGQELVEVEVKSPGFYRLSAAGQDGFKPLPRQSFVANIDPAESHLIKTAFVARPARGGESAPSTRHIELWHVIGLLLLLLVAGESLLTRR